MSHSATSNSSSVVDSTMDNNSTKNRLPFAAVLWDIDGTLADSEPIHERAFVDTCEELGLKLNDTTDSNFLGKTEENTHQWLVEVHNLHVNFNDWSLFRIKHYLSRIDDMEPHKIAMDIWVALESLGVAQAVVSNADRMVVQANLEHLNLVRPGLVSIARNDVREGKPNPEPYLRAAHLLGFEPHTCAAVEDSIPGATSAMQAGMHVYTMPWINGRPDFKTEDIAALSDLVKEM